MFINFSLKEPVKKRKEGLGLVYFLFVDLVI